MADTMETASAGKIIILPKGNYNAFTDYKILDLVNYNGVSWLAKKPVKGIEPSEANAEYWHRMFDYDIVNNLTTETEGHALDARQGKVLADAIAVERTRIDNLVAKVEALSN